MKVCIVSDSHDHRPLLEAAVRAAKAAGAEAVLHCGDVVAPSTLSVITPLGLPVHVIHGNNVGDLFMMARVASKPGNRITFYGQDAGIELAGRRIFLVHYPHYARAMATTGDWDLVCCGHDHEANIETVKNVTGTSTWLVNPGTVGGVAAPATWVLGDLETMNFSIQDVHLEPAHPNEPQANPR
jgi:putative phosphoesterase